MLSEPMSRRAIIRFTVAAVVSTIACLLFRPVTIDVAAGTGLLAFALYGVAGYGVLERLVDRRQRSRR